MMQQNDVVVELSDLHFKRGTQPICAGMNLKVRRGQITAIMGPSGAGKTTLLRLIGKQVLADSGRIDVFGRDITQVSRDELYALRKRMGMLFQSGALFSDLDVYENVAFPLRLHTTLSEPLIRQMVLLKLEAVGLRNAHHLMPAELSGGMSRRAALARTIALDPELVLYDEPFTGQDPISMGILVQLIKQLNQALGLTSILISHDIAESLSIADYIYIIAQGRVIGEGTADMLKTSTDPWIKQFVHGLPDGPVPFHYPGTALESDLMKDSA